MRQLHCNSIFDYFAAWAGLGWAIRRLTNAARRGQTIKCARIGMWNDTGTGRAVREEEHTRGALSRKGMCGMGGLSAGQ